MRKFNLFKESIEAQEIYTQYKSNLEEGMNNGDAYKDLYDYYQDFIDDPYSLESILFWIVVALFQWEYGFLDEMIKEKVIDIIDHNKIRLLDDGYSFLSNLTEVEKDFIDIKELLLSKNSRIKKIKTKVRYIDSWLIGDVFIYKIDLHNTRPIVVGGDSLEKDKYGIDGKFIALQKVKNAHMYPNNIVPCLAVFNWIGDEIPSDLSVFDNMDFIIFQYDSPESFSCLHDILVSSQKEFTDLQIEHIGHIPLKDEMIAYFRDEHSRHLYINSVNSLSVKLYISLYVHTENHMVRYDPRFKIDIKNGRIYSSSPMKIY